VGKIKKRDRHAVKTNHGVYKVILTLYARPLLQLSCQVLLAVSVVLTIYAANLSLFVLSKSR